jgi:hypothetical protein
MQLRGSLLERTGRGEWSARARTHTHTPARHHNNAITPASKRPHTPPRATHQLWEYSAEVTKAMPSEAEERSQAREWGGCNSNHRRTQMDPSTHKMSAVCIPLYYSPPRAVPYLLSCCFLACPVRLLGFRLERRSAEEGPRRGGAGTVVHTRGCPRTLPSPLPYSACLRSLAVHRAVRALSLPPRPPRVEGTAVLCQPNTPHRAVWRGLGTALLRRKQKEPATENGINA